MDKKFDENENLENEEVKINNHEDLESEVDQIENIDEDSSKDNNSGYDNNSSVDSNEDKPEKDNFVRQVGHHEENFFMNDGEEKRDDYILGEEVKTDEDKKSQIPEDIKIEAENKSNKKSNKKKKKKSKFRGSLTSYIILALVASIIGGLASDFIAPKLYGNLLPYPGGTGSNGAVTINTTDDIGVVSAVAKKTISSVVGITTLETQQFLFEERDVEGVGSGVIINSDGYILTNSHVIADGNAKEIKVLLYDGTTLDGKVLWSDRALDLAVVKVNGSNLPSADLGNSEDLEIGEVAIAIGNPLGLEFQRSVTSGIISGLNRAVRVDQNTIMDNLIQTDASINRGNSGGPLLNSKGEVIGINTAKINSAEGLGFSIPINIAKPIVEEVIKTGKYETVSLGIGGYDVAQYQASLGIDLGVEDGVIVIESYEDTPAHDAGIMNGDIIVKVDDKEIESMQALKKVLYGYKSGDTVELTIIRNKEEMKVPVTFAEK